MTNSDKKIIRAVFRGRDPSRRFIVYADTNHARAVVIQRRWMPTVTIDDIMDYAYTCGYGS